MVTSRCFRNCSGTIYDVYGWKIEILTIMLIISDDQYKWRGDNDELKEKKIEIKMEWKG